ncbi:MAG: FG-GAP repeat domain-containing protein [Nitrospinota bacterium]
MRRSSRTGFTGILSLAFLALMCGAGWGQPKESNAPRQGESPDHRVALERIARKLQERFPRVGGLVASVRGNELYLALEQERGVGPGARMTVFRKMGAFKHPLTGEVLGHFEENLGNAVVTDVREKFVIARFEPKGESSPRAGDGVRITAAQIHIALLPIQNQTQDRFNQGALLLDFQTLLERTGRFRVFDVDKLQVWFLENRIPVKDALKPGVRDQLRRFVRTDLVLSGVLRKLGGRQVLESQLASLADGKARETFTALVERLPAVAAAVPRQRRPGSGGLQLDEGPQRPQDRASRLNPNFRIRRGVPRRGIQRSQKLNWVASGIAVGDFDGDKRQEVAFAYNNHLSIYRWEKGVLSEKYLYRATPADRFLSIDAIDLDKNGRPEIYVTSYRHPTLNTFVLTYEGGKYKVAASRLSVFFRVIQPGKEKPMLVGQALGVEEPFYGPVYEYAWSGSGEPTPKRALPLPRDVSVYGFNYWDVDGDGIEEIVQINDFGRLIIYRPDGKKIFQTAQRYGGYLGEFRYDQAVERPETLLQPDGADAEAKFQTIRGRLLLQDVTGDGRPDLIVPLNVRRVEFSSTFGMGDAQIVALRWDGSNLTEEWRSRRVGGVIVDYQFVDLDGDGAQELVVAVVESKVLSLKSGVSRLVVYQLKKS